MGGRGEGRRGGRKEEGEGGKEGGRKEGGTERKMGEGGRKKGEEKGGGRGYILKVPMYLYDMLLCKVILCITNI